jgi:hypothetical protein
VIVEQLAIPAIEEVKDDIWASGNRLVVKKNYYLTDAKFEKNQAHVWHICPKSCHKCSSIAL